MTANARTISYQPRHLVHVLLTSILVLSGVYMYFLSAAVVNVVVQTETERSIHELRSEISLLETDYIAAQHVVSQRISSLEGYNEVAEKKFIDRRSPSLVLGNTR